MKVIVKGEPKEIAALVLAIQGRQCGDEDSASQVADAICRAAQTTIRGIVEDEKKQRLKPSLL